MHFDCAKMTNEYVIPHKEIRKSRNDDKIEHINCEINASKNIKSMNKSKSENNKITNENASKQNRICVTEKSSIQDDTYPNNKVLIILG